MSGSGQKKISKVSSLALEMCRSRNVDPKGDTGDIDQESESSWFISRESETSSG